MQIRHYTPSDFRSILSLFLRAVHQGCAPRCTPAQLTAWAPTPPDVVQWTTLLSSGLTWVGADRAGELLGFVRITRDGTLCQLYVDPDHGRRGIGVKLLQTALTWAGEERLASVRVVVPPVAKSFFERQGFFVTHDHDDAHHSLPASFAMMCKPLLATASAT